MKTIIRLIASILCVISAKGDENTKLISSQIQQDRAVIEESWENINDQFKTKFKQVDMLRDKALDIESCLGKNYFVSKEEIYESINDLKSVFLHKRTSEENYAIIAKGISTMLFINPNLPLDKDISEIFKNAKNTTTSDGCELCTHNDAIQIVNQFNNLHAQEVKDKLSKENLLSYNDYSKMWDFLMKQFELESQKHDKLVSDINMRIHQFNAYLDAREKVLDEKIRQNNNWQMQQKLEEMNSKINSLQMNQRW